jgi:hypothetical protein
MDIQSNALSFYKINNNNNERSGKSNSSCKSSTKCKPRDFTQSESPFQNQIFPQLLQLIKGLIEKLQSQNEENMPRTVSTTNKQRDLIAQTLGVNADSISITDADGSNTISAGDQITATYSTDTGGTESRTLTIDAGFASDIRGELNNNLNIDQSLASNIANHLGVIPFGSGLGGIQYQIFDQDKSGALSAGDVIKGIGYNPGGQGTPVYHTITQENMLSLQNAGI